MKKTLKTLMKNKKILLREIMGAGKQNISRINNWTINKEKL